MNGNPATRHLIVVGPTASGKTDLALRVAKATGAEIVSVDAFQIYRGMDVGTGKPTPEERGDILHHGLDVADPCTSFTVADYLKHAAGWIQRHPPVMIWVGGTGLYVSALLRGLSPAPPVPQEVRDELEGWPLHLLQDAIQKADPEWAATADLNNPRRIVRALGVARATGRPMSVWQRSRQPGLLADAPVFLYGRETAELRERIKKRIGNMIERGWADEVERLAGVAGWEESPSSRAIGYREVLAWKRGRMNLASCIDSIEKQTWQYARRQLTWFRHQCPATPLGPEPESEQQLLDWIHS
ncbi:MAG: tRNA (adenosine(37)-N6)-dimethylallyltransferase MiaA [Candidatus Methylacidiphilales bacterium]